MHNLIYKITNLVNGKIYIGAHTTKDINDGYMGSGKILKLAIEKYGLNNFSKEVLFDFPTKKQMFLKEAELVTAEFLSGNVYNIKLGGEGGWDHISKSPEFLEICSKGVAESNRTRDMSGVSKTLSNTLKRMYNEGTRIADPNFKNAFKGKTHSDETKKIISEKAKVHSAGERNSQFGSMWITDGINSKKISKTDIIPVGWKRGRKIKQGSVAELVIALPC